MDSVNAQPQSAGHLPLSAAHSVTLTRPDAHPQQRQTEGSNNTPQDTGQTDNRPRALVIGAGLGGLSAAITLAHHGYKVDIFEQNTHSGGRMDIIEEQGFRIDMGPSMLMMPEVVEKIFADCGRDWQDYLTIKRVDPAYKICWTDGTCLEMGTTAAEMEAQVRTFAPEDAEAFRRLFASMRAKYQNARFNFIERRFNSVSDLIHPRTLNGFRKALPLETVWNFVSKHVKSEKMRQAFTFQTLYLGISPFACPSIYALLPFIEMEFGVWFPQGGMHAIAEALEKLFAELGGTIHFNQPVERILLHGKRATGLRTSDGNDWHGDVVVCNMDLPTAYSQLLPADVRRKNTDARMASFEYGCSGYLLYLGVKRIPSHLGHNAILLSDDYKGVLDDICVRKVLPRDPAMHLCIPTRTDPSLAPPDHDIVYVLVPVPNTQADIDWAIEAPKLRERVLDKLEAATLPGLRDAIVFEREMTPPDFEKRYGCYAGAAYGGLNPTFLQSAYFRPHSKSEDVDSLYFVGASTHPGGGMPIVLTSGRLAAEEIVAKTKKR